MSASDLGMGDGEYERVMRGVRADAVTRMRADQERMFFGTIGLDATPAPEPERYAPELVLWIDETASFGEGRYRKLMESLQQREVPMDEELEVVLARFDSVACDEDQVKAIDELRVGAKEFAALIVKLCPGGRSKALALTHLEDSSVYSIKAVAHDT